MTTHHLIIELRWSRNLALGLAIALALPVLAVAGLLTALAAHPGATPASVALSAPTTLAYQGQVKVNGQLFTGLGQFKFAIVNAGGLAVWTNDGSALSTTAQPASAVSLNVNAGLFDVLLGDLALPHMTQPITSGVFLQPRRALRVWFNDGVNGFQQLAPDVALAAVPYALNAQTLDGVDSSAFLTPPQADARYARLSPTTQQIALLKWYTAVSGTVSTFPVALEPFGIAFDGANMWVTNFSDGSISVLRAHDGFHVMTPTVFGDPSGIAFDGANMWVTNDGDIVSVLRAHDGSTVMTPTVGAGPTRIAFDGTNMWVTNLSDGTVSVLRASNGHHVMTPTVGLSPRGIAFDGANMWVANSGASTVSVLGVSDGAHVMTLTVGSIPDAVAFDGANVWVTNFGSGTVSVLRASDGSHVMTPTVGSQPEGIAFDGTNMWVTNSGDKTVSVLRASDGSHVMTPTVGNGPFGIAFDGAFMWVVNSLDNTVSKR